jgi:hypothetical protein
MMHLGTLALVLPAQIVQGATAVQKGRAVQSSQTALAASLILPNLVFGTHSVHLCTALPDYSPSAGAAGIGAVSRAGKSRR